MNIIYHRRRTIDRDNKLDQLNYSTQLILEAAEQCGVDWEKVPYTPAFKLSYQGTTKYFSHRVPSETNSFAADSCQDKRITNNLLKHANIRVNNSYVIKPTDSPIYHQRLYKSLQKPLVVKPNDSSLGHHVTINISDMNDYSKAIADIYSYNGQREVDILVEEMFQEAQEYRILATTKKILSVIKRTLPNVVGNGRSTIRQLIEIKNRHPFREKIETYAPIDINRQLVQHLAEQTLTVDSVPSSGEEIVLFPPTPFNVNVWIGGDTIDVTDQIHPTVTETVKKIMAAIPGLSLAGIDYMTKDIQAPQTADNYRVIEVNSSPCLDWNQYPLVGPKRPIGFEFLKIMFPNLKQPSQN